MTKLVHLMVLLTGTVPTFFFSLIVKELPTAKYSTGTSDCYFKKNVKKLKEREGGGVVQRVKKKEKWKEVLKKRKKKTFSM